MSEGAAYRSTLGNPEVLIQPELEGKPFALLIEHLMAQLCLESRLQNRRIQDALPSEEFDV